MIPTTAAPMPADLACVGVFDGAGVHRLPYCQKCSHYALHQDYMGGKLQHQPQYAPPSCCPDADEARKSHLAGQKKERERKASREAYMRRLQKQAEADAPKPKKPKASAVAINPRAKRRCARCASYQANPDGVAICLEDGLQTHSGNKCLNGLYKPITKPKTNNQKQPTMDTKALSKAASIAKLITALEKEMARIDEGEKDYIVCKCNKCSRVPGVKDVIAKKGILAKYAEAAVKEARAALAKECEKLKADLKAELQAEMEKL